MSYIYQLKDDNVDLNYKDKDELYQKELVDYVLESRDIHKIYNLLLYIKGSEWDLLLQAFLDAHDVHYIFQLFIYTLSNTGLPTDKIIEETIKSAIKTKDESYMYQILKIIPREAYAFKKALELRLLLFKSICDTKDVSIMFTCYFYFSREEDFVYQMLLDSILASRNYYFILELLLKVGDIKTCKMKREKNELFLEKNYLRIKNILMECQDKELYLEFQNRINNKLFSRDLEEFIKLER